MSEDKWFSLNEAGLSIGRSKAYFSLVRKQHPEYFENVELKQVADTLIINQEGIDEVLKHVKKEGDHVRTSILVWSTKQTTTLLLPHFNLNIFQRLKSSEKFLQEIIRIFKLSVYTNSVMV